MTFVCALTVLCVLKAYEFLTDNSQFSFKFLCTFTFSQDNLE